MYILTAALEIGLRARNKKVCAVDEYEEDSFHRGLRDELRGVNCGCMKIEANSMNFELPLVFELALVFVCVPPVWVVLFYFIFSSHWVFLKTVPIRFCHLRGSNSAISLTSF